ncbi:MAG: UvrB/UvrC motif-containing protein, partial [Alistipes sp.]|nr:UvrB/UvrC motif-containing protein [Alistipes sp.]
THIVDPPLRLRPSENQIDDLLDDINRVVHRGEKVIVTTISKRSAEDMSGYLDRIGIRNRYIHSDIETLNRIQILEDMREDRIDVIVGVNLLREGIDLPEVSLVAIIDADKEGFLRNVRAITQIAGRAARHTNGQVNLYGDRLTGTLRTSLIESNRRRAKQIAYNLEHGVLPRRAKKSGTGSALLSERPTAEDTTPSMPYNAPQITPNSVAEPMEDYTATPTANALQGTLETLIEEARKAMEEAAKSLDFVAAAKHRDRMRELQKLATDSK